MARGAAHLRAACEQAGLVVLAVHDAEWSAGFPDHAWWRAAARNDDLYLVHGDGLWSFVLTHEESMGLGPFFVESRGEGAVSAACSGPNFRQRRQRK